jgi:peptidoglycan hydrolase-like protein with peptidoglycan-binding domain
MSDNPLIEAFLKIHEGGKPLEEKVGPRPNQPSTTSSAEGLAMGRGAFNNFTMGAGKYARAAADYTAKTLGSLAGMSEPTTFDKELEQENEKDIAAQRDFPDAYKKGEIGSIAAQMVSGVGAAKALAGVAIRSAAKKVAKTAADDARQLTNKDFELGGSYNPTPPPIVNTPPRYLTVGERVPSRPATLKLTKQMRTEEENDSSKGNTEMSTNPFIKGFLKLQEKVGPRPGTGDAALIKSGESRSTAISNPVTDRTGNSSPSTTSYRLNTPAMNPRGADTSGGVSGNPMGDFTGDPNSTPTSVKPVVEPTENKPKVSNLSSSSAKLKVSPDRDRQASPIAPAGTTTSNLRVGSSGDEVKRAQKALGITADGSYGPQTRQAVIDFQTKNNLKADGIIGDQTLSMMNRQKDLGESEMSTNPYIKGFFDIEEARAKNTNIFDESKKLTAAQKKNLDKNDNDKIDAEDFKMLRKEESDLDEAKKTNSMVMARNISKVLKAAKPDFLDIDKDGDKEESMKKAAAMKEESEQIDEISNDLKKSYLAKAKDDVADRKKTISQANKIKNASRRNFHSHSLWMDVAYKNQDKNDSRKAMMAKAKDSMKVKKDEVELDEAKKPKPGHNARVMANNLDKVFKAKPDFLDIDKDGDKEESMKKAAADKKKESDLDEANILPSNFSDRTTPVPNKKAYAIDKANSEKKKPVSLKKAPFDMKKEEIERDKYGYGYYGDDHQIVISPKTRQGKIIKSTGLHTVKKTVKKQKPEEANLDEAVNEKQIRKDLDSGMSHDAVIGKHANKKTTNTDEIRKVIKQHAFDKRMKKEEVEFSEEEIDFINNVMEAMPVAPTSENDSPNPTPKKKAEGSRAKGSMAD